MKPHNLLIFIVAVLLILGFISTVFPKDGIDVGVRKLYFPNIEDILLASNTNNADNTDNAVAVAPPFEHLKKNDSITAGYADSLAHYISFFETSSNRIILPDNDWNFFNDFFADLDSSSKRGEIVRVLHYGDSQIEADRMTDYIRQHLQEKFGGAGPGLVAAQPMPSYSVLQSASENIERYAIAGAYQNPASHNRYGVLGQFSAVNGHSSMSLRVAKKAYENTKQIQTIRLFVGRNRNFSARLAIQKQVVEKPIVTDDSSAVKVYTWNLSTPTNIFSLYTSGFGEIYGIAADGTSGVAVDNIPFRASAGTFFKSLNKDVMSSMLQHLNVRLIILQFGGNAVSANTSGKAIKNYCEKLANQIAYFQEIYPEAKIMLIGPADRSTKINGRLTTYPSLEPLVEAMKETAMQNGAAFWNTYEAMGGKNSMVKWVHRSPELGASDYIHFTGRGIEKIASMFYEALMVYYDYYRFETNKGS